MAGRHGPQRIAREHPVAGVSHAAGEVAALALGYAEDRAPLVHECLELVELRGRDRTTGERVAFFIPRLPLHGEEIPAPNAIEASEWAMASID